MVRVVQVHGVGQGLLGSHVLLTLAWFDPLTMALTATMLGVQPGTVTAQLHRSHASLRRLEEALHSGAAMSDQTGHDWRLLDRQRAFRMRADAELRLLERAEYAARRGRPMRQRC